MMRTAGAVVFFAPPVPAGFYFTVAAVVGKDEGLLA